MLFQLLLYQVCFSGLCLHNPFCYKAYTWNATQKLGRNILNKIGELMRMRNNINKIKCEESAKNAAPGWTGLMSFSQTKAFTKGKDWRSPEPHLECFYLKLAHSFPLFPPQKETDSTFTSAYPSTPKSCSSCPFCFSVWRLRIHL